MSPLRPPLPRKVGGSWPPSSYGSAAPVRGSSRGSINQSIDWCNQLCWITLQSAPGFRFCKWSKFAVFHWIAASTCLAIFTLSVIGSLIIVYLCYVVIHILLTNLGLLTLSAFWLNSANVREKIKTGVSTAIIAIRHNAKLNYLNRNITKDALNFYAESTHENGGVR